MQERIVFRMSESGKCPKALSAKLLGYEPEPAPVWLETAANEGKWHEERLIQELYETDSLITIERQKEVVLDFPSFTLVGHIDGMVYPSDATGNETKLLEIKTMSQFEFDRWMRDGFKGFPTYASQITCYMEATGLRECLYIVKNRSSGYEDRKIITSPTSFDAIIKGLETITVFAQSGQDLDSELGKKLGNFDPQSLECRRCDYKHLCVPEVKELTPIEEAGLSAVAKDWRQGKQLVSEGQELVDKAREVLEAHTRATNILKWRHSGLVIQLIHYKEFKTYPKAKLLKVFTEEQLESASDTKEAYDQLRIDDLLKETSNG